MTVVNYNTAPTELGAACLEIFADEFPTTLLRQMPGRCDFPKTVAYELMTAYGLLQMRGGRGNTEIIIYNELSRFPYISRGSLTSEKKMTREKIFTHEMLHPTENPPKRMSPKMVPRSCHAFPII